MGARRQRSRRAGPRGPRRRARPAAPAAPTRSDEYVGMTSVGRGPALQGFLLTPDPTAYYGLQQDMFNGLNNDITTT